MIDIWSLDHEIGEPRKAAIYIVGTGHPMPDELTAQLVPAYHGGADTVLPMFTQKFLGTVVTPVGLVWHVFEGPVRATEGK